MVYATHHLHSTIFFSSYGCGWMDRCDFTGAIWPVSLLKYEVNLLETEAEFQ